MPRPSCWQVQCMLICACTAAHALVCSTTGWKRCWSATARASSCWTPRQVRTAGRRCRTSHRQWFVSYRLAVGRPVPCTLFCTHEHKAQTMFLNFCLPALLAGQRHLRTAVLDRSYLQAVDLQEARKRYRCAVTLRACAVRRLRRMACGGCDWVGCCCCCCTVHPQLRLAHPPGCRATHSFAHA